MRHAAPYNPNPTIQINPAIQIDQEIQVNQNPARSSTPDQTSYQDPARLPLGSVTSHTVGQK